MKSFKQYITEVIDWDKNSLFAIGPSKKIEYYHDRKGSMIEHPDAFKHLNFMDRPHSGELMVGIQDLRDPNASHLERPKAISWGRIDHTNGVVHIVTKYGMSPYGTAKGEYDKRKRVTDVFDRLDALKQLKIQYPNYDIHHLYEVPGSLRTPRIVSYSQYEKELTDHLKEE